MRSPFFRLFTWFIFVAVFVPPIYGAKTASTDLQTNRLFHKLEQLPAGLTPYSRVETILRTLIKLDPLKSPKYFDIGIMRIFQDESFSANGFRLRRQALKQIKRSDLTDSQKSKIKVQIIFEFPRGPL